MTGDHPDSGPEATHPLVDAFIEELQHIPDGTCTLSQELNDLAHATIAAIENPVELGAVAESLLNIAINLDNSGSRAELSLAVGRLAKAAADRAVTLRGKLTNSLDRVSDNAAQYQRFMAEKPKDAPKDEPPPAGTVRLGDIDPKRRP